MVPCDDDDGIVVVPTPVAVLDAVPPPWSKNDDMVSVSKSVELPAITMVHNARPFANVHDSPASNAADGGSGA